MTEQHQVDRWEELRDLLFEWDPLGVADVRTYAQDEYDCVIGPLTGLLLRGATEEEIVSFLYGMLDDHFGLSPAPDLFLDATRTLVVNAMEWHRKWDS